MPDADTSQQCLRNHESRLLDHKNGFVLESAIRCMSRKSIENGNCGVAILAPMQESDLPTYEAFGDIDGCAMATSQLPFSRHSNGYLHWDALFYLERRHVLFAVNFHGGFALTCIRHKRKAELDALL